MADTSHPPDAAADALGRMLAEYSDQFVCLANSRGEPAYLNPAGYRLLGLDGKEVTSGITLRELYDEASWAELRDVAGPTVNRVGQWQGRSRLRNIRTGGLIDVETRVFRVKSETGHTLLAVLHRTADEPARLQAALAEAQARKRAILESSLDPIITISAKGIITEFNRAAEQTFGHPRDKIIGTKPSDVLFPSATSAGQQDRIDRYLDVGEGSLLGRRVEVTAVRADGELFDAEMAMTINSEQGEHVMTFFVRDISRRKKAEQEQSRYAAELERSNRELEQFAYVASHDLQEPLRKICTFSDRLQMLCTGKLDDAAVDCIERMQAAAERMQSLIDGLLSLSRVTTQGQGFVPVDLDKVAREVVSDLEDQVDRVHGVVEVGRLPTIQADPLQVRQLLQNLIANGLKFHRVAEPPIVKISSQFLARRQERLSGRSTATEQCRIVVEDNGIGFEEKHRERIFGVFQRLHPREVFEGTGIGLALCRKIAERHGGQISASSTVGQGSRFEILLPVTHREAQ